MWNFDVVRAYMQYEILVVHFRIIKVSELLLHEQRARMCSWVSEYTHKNKCTSAHTHNTRRAKARPFERSESSTVFNISMGSNFDRGIIMCRDSRMCLVTLIYCTREVHTLTALGKWNTLWSMKKYIMVSKFNLLFAKHA